jgi:16S rRNA (cytidine1402-2'-O)-methyltransferase
MTKMFEEYWRGNVSGAVEHFKSQPARGEFTLVVEGKTPNGNERWTEEQLQRAIKNEMKTEKSAKEISIELAGQSGWSKKDVYRLINRKEN